MQPHLLDPMLMSHDISEDQRKLILFHEIGHLAYEVENLSSLVSNDTRPKGTANYGKFVSIAEQAHQLILMSKRLFGTVEAMNEHLKKFSLRQTTANDPAERAQYLTVAGAALMHETPAYDSTSEWLRQWFKVDEFSSSKNRLPNLRFRAGVFNDRFNSAQENLYQQPRFFADGKFRNLQHHRFFFSEAVSQHFTEMFADIRRNKDAAVFWAGKIDEADADLNPESTLRTEMIAQLSTLPLDGLWDFRRLMIGQSRPSCEECSARLSSLLTNATYYELDDQQLSSTVKALSYNSVYVEEVLADEIADKFKSDIDDYSNDDSNRFDGGPRVIAQITKVFAALELSPESLAKIAMSAVAGFKRGKMRDLQEETVSDQLVKVIQSVHRSGRLQMTPDELKYALFASITKSLPKSLVENMAAVDDHAKATCYALTGNSHFLKGLQDRKLQESMLGQDLGL